MKPPSLARALLRLLTPARDRDAVVSDVDEVFLARSARSALRARVWYWRQAFAALSVFRLPRVRFRSPRAAVRGVVLDIRHACRLLAHSRSYTAVAVLSLALGIGATTSLYAAVRVALLDAMPVDRPAQLRIAHWRGEDGLRVSQYNSGGYIEPASGMSFRTNFSYPAYRAIAAVDPRAVAFNFLPRRIVESEGIAPHSASGLIVSGNAFSELGIPVARGRGLAPEDDATHAAGAVVLTHAFWRSAFGGDPDVIGRTMRIKDVPFVITGVTGSAFSGLSTGGRITPASDYIVTTAAQPALWSANGGPSHQTPRVLWLRIITRLADGESEVERIERMTAALKRSLSETGVATGKGLDEVRMSMRNGARGVDAVAGSAERPLRILAGVVAIVVLITCVNLAALMLGRGVARQRELAVRQAIGASRGRVIQQLLVESLTLASLGGLAGIVLAMWTRPIVASMLRTGLGAHTPHLTFDWWTFGVAAAATIAASAIFGLLPAVRLTSGGLVSRLRQHMIGASSPRLLAGRVLLAVQIAASVPLIVAAILLLRTLQKLDAVDTGFNSDHIVLFRVDGLPSAETDPTRHKLRVSAILQRIETMPDVSSATLVENVLLSGLVSDNRVDINGRQASWHMNGVGPRFFETFQIPLVAGRPPTLDDDTTRPNVAVINQTAAAAFGPESPIGRRFKLGPRQLEVIGVAADTKYADVRDTAKPTVFDPYLQRAGGLSVNVAVRTRLEDARVFERLRAAALEAAPQSAVVDMRTQRDQIAQLSGRERLLAKLLSLFGAFAVILACVGLYGATAYSVARRTSEIGVRIALGARRPQVLWMILRSVLMLTTIGLAAGLATALATSKLLASFLFELQPHDPLSLAAALLLMLGVSIAAGALPATRASRIEPLTALRRE